MIFSNSLGFTDIKYTSFMAPFISHIRLLLLVGIMGWGSAQATLLSESALSIDKVADAAVLEDAQGQWTFEQVSSPDMAGQFKAWGQERGQINLGFSKSVYWIRVPLQRQAEAPTSWVIEVPFFQLNTLDFFAPGRAAIETGGSRPLTSRPFLHRFFAFPVEVSTEPQMYYMRVTSHHSVTVPLTVWQEQAFRHHVQSTLILQALYFGGLMALLIYNLFLAISLTDLRFLLYTLFVGNFGLGMLAGNGFGQMFVWPDQGEFDGIAQTFFLCLAGAFSMLFADRFLQTPRYMPWASHGLRVFAAFYFFDALALVSAPWHGLGLQWIVELIFFVTLPAGALVVFSGLRGMQRGHKGVRFFLLAWLVLWMGAITATLRAFEIVPTNVFTGYSLQLSSAVEMLLLALALADVIHVERREREFAQREALLANQRLLESARLSEERLEGEVQKRTQQLESALDTETKLLEKYMRFGALISHEFRNPLGIVDSQISLLRKEHEKGQLNLEKRLNTMASATRRLLSLFETWLDGDRLQRAMQEIKPQHIPLAAWLRELVDAQTSYHDEHPLTLKIHQPVSDIWADENLLEVAVLNLIDNACKYSEAGQPVMIETRTKPGWIGIVVTDQGCGIDSKDHEAVFDDYHRVTSESTISGLGLGLAFGRRIVERHQGTLELDSAIGEGSSFCLWLPHK
jgi:two-component system, sensor histidine kinase LadS